MPWRSRPSDLRPGVRQPCRRMLSGRTPTRPGFRPLSGSALTISGRAIAQTARQSPADGLAWRPGASATWTSHIPPHPPRRTPALPPWPDARTPLAASLTAQPRLRSLARPARRHQGFGGVVGTRLRGGPSEWKGKARPARRKRPEFRHLRVSHIRGRRLRSAPCSVAGDATIAIAAPSAPPARLSPNRYARRPPPART